VDTATVGTAAPSASRAFRIGSVTKTLRHLPGVVPAGGRITIRELLDHRSGLTNFIDHDDWLRRAERSAATRPIDTLRFAASRPLEFPPRARRAYSNTNYVALGLVIERVTRDTYAHQLERRIIAPWRWTPRGCRGRGTWPACRTAEPIRTSPGPRAGSSSTLATSGRSSAPCCRAAYCRRAGLRELQRVVAVPGDPDYALGIAPARLSCGTAWGNDGVILDYGTGVEAADHGSRVAVVSLRGAVSPAPDETATLLLCPRRVRG